MRILVIHWGRTGGGPRFAFEQAVGLAAQEGVEVYVSYNRDSEIAHEWECFPEDRRFPVRTYRSRIGVVLGFPRLISVARSLRRFLIDHQIDLVFSSMFSIWQSLALPIYKRRSLPFVSSVHDAVPHPGERELTLRFCKWVEKAYARGLVVYSQSVFDQVKSWNLRGKKVVLSAHGVKTIDRGPRVLREPGPDTPIVLGFFGRIMAYKGLELFVEAVTLLRESGYLVAGEVFGQGEVDQKLQRDSSGLIEWHVRWVQEDEVSAILERFDVLVAPYTEASQSGVVALAAGAALPVVVTPVGGLAEQVAKLECGVVSTECNGASVALALREVLQSAEYASFSRHAWENSRDRLAWNNVCARLRTDLERMLVQ